MERFGAKIIAPPYNKFENVANLMVSIVYYFLSIIIKVQCSIFNPPLKSSTEYYVIFLSILYDVIFQ
jgi:hypothetical protein